MADAGAGEDGIDHLFVYGTLRRDAGHAAHRRLASARFVAAASFRGRLYRIDTYPGAVVSAAPDDVVRGEVYELNDPARILPALDRYEGCDPSDPTLGLFRRAIAEVTLDGGGGARAWIYLFNGETAALPRIHSGDYCAPGHVR